jgi:hypothetical protein
MLSPDGVLVWHDFDILHSDVFKYINLLAMEHVIYHIPSTSFALLCRRGVC